MALWPSEHDLPGGTSGFSAGTAREAAALIEDLFDRMLPLVEGVGARVEDEIALFERKGLPLPPDTAWRQAHLVRRLPEGRGGPDQERGQGH